MRRFALLLWMLLPFLSCTLATLIPDSAALQTLGPGKVLRVTDVHGRYVESRIHFVRSDTLFLVPSVPLGVQPDTVAVALSDVQAMERVEIDGCRTRWLLGSLTALCCLMTYLFVLFVRALTGTT